MIKPNMSAIPGMSAMTDTLDFVKNLWGGMSIPGMGIPGMVMPTLSVDEINKQISDLKAVESWLTLNMNMLRGTIQALEVQSATISTLQSMGETLSAAVRSSTAAKPKSASESMPGPTPEPAPRDEVEKAPIAAAQQAAAEPEPKSEPKEQAAKFVAPQANPAVWWNMLQDQFKQAVNSTMASEPAKPANKPAPVAAKPKTAAKAAKTVPLKRKPAAKKRVSKA
jgi:hypothetical protein